MNIDFTLIIKKHNIIFSILKASSFFLLFYEIHTRIVYMEIVIVFVAVFVGVFHGSY